MRMMIWIVFILLIVLVGVALLAGWWRTYRVEKSPQQAVFESGAAETAGLDGDYAGTVSGYSGSWQGKSFDEEANTGINNFLKNGQVVRKYPFTTYVAKGLRDPQLDVVKIDYNQPENPWWLRLIMDEIVKTGPDTYLGKVHIRVLPGVVFTCRYFSLVRK